MTATFMHINITNSNLNMNVNGGKLELGESCIYAMMQENYIYIYTL